MGRDRKGLGTWIGLGAIIAVFCCRAALFHPSEFLDYYHDDAVYFSTAKALAAGQGYVIPSFPGVLPQTKYPILYPLVLSVVWHLSPQFPASLTLAIALSIAIAAAYLVLSYVFLRRAGMSKATSLCIIAIIALHPGLAFLAGSLLSDYLFAILTIASAMAADEMWRMPDQEQRWALTTGLLLALAMLTRSVSIGAVGGIALCGMLQRRWRAVAGMAMTCGAIAGAAVLVTHLTCPHYVAAGTGTPPAGFQHVLTYYSSYARFWMLSVPQVSVLGEMLWDNLRWLLLAPGNYFLMVGITLSTNSFTVTLALLASAIAVGGIMRWYRVTQRRTIVFVLFGNLPILLLWNYPIYDRFLVAFVPLILLGLGVELRRIASLVTAAMRDGKLANRALGMATAVALLALVSLVAYNYWRLGTALEARSRERARLNHQRRQAYAWIARHTPTSARVLAYEDGLLYFYTARQSVRPVVITTDCYYQPQRKTCRSDFSEMGSWLGYVNAQYWLTDSDDLQSEGERRFRPEVRQHVAVLKSRMEPVFVSSNGSVVVYDTTCLVDEKDPNCHGGSSNHVSKLRPQFADPAEAEH